jgi:hypothetical protein
MNSPFEGKSLLIPPLKGARGMFKLSNDLQPGIQRVINQEEFSFFEGGQGDVKLVYACK